MSAAAPGVAVRLAAAKCLDRVETSGDRLGDFVARQRFGDPRDARLLREIAAGVLRNRILLSRLIERAAAVRERACRPRVFRVLLLGAYQLLFLDRVPARAAVGTAVEVARRLFSAREAGFVNAVLRKVAALYEGGLPAEPAGTVDERKCFLLPDGRRGTLSAPLLPSREDARVFLSVRFSHPEWLVGRWLARFGRAVTERICRAGCVTPLLFIRANRLKGTVEELAARLTAEGARCRAVTGGAGPDKPDGGFLAVECDAPLEDLASFREGLFAVQDPAQGVPVALLDLQPGERVLDLCAAPGGKTCDAAERVGPAGAVTAVDVSPERLAKVAANAGRLCLSNVTVVAADAATIGERLPGPFPAVLLDVPCSNTGVLARRPEVRGRLNEEGLARLCAIQKGLLAAAVARVPPGGRLVYSTCSLEEDENGGVVRSALEQNPQLRLAEERLTLPGNGSGGGYAALLRVD